MRMHANRSMLVALQIGPCLSPCTELNSERVRDLSPSPVLNLVKKEAETGLNSRIFLTKRHQQHRQQDQQLIGRNSQSYKVMMTLGIAIGYRMGRDQVVYLTEG